VCIVQQWGAKSQTVVIAEARIFGIVHANLVIVTFHKKQPSARFLRLIVKFAVASRAIRKPAERPKNLRQSRDIQTEANASGVIVLGVALIKRIVDTDLSLVTKFTHAANAELQVIEAVFGSNLNFDYCHIRKGVFRAVHRAVVHRAVVHRAVVHRAVDHRVVDHRAVLVCII
jgi:hypothetical protein